VAVVWIKRQQAIKYEAFYFYLQLGELGYSQHRRLTAILDLNTVFHADAMRLEI
jgi:hypothetical protein